MEHAAHLVDILDVDGKVTHQKARREVDKNKDIYHSIYVLLMTPENDILLSVIPAREDLPNIYSSSYGTTLATIRRHNETADQAAVRAISRELFIDDTKPIRVGEAFEELSDNRKVLATVYYFKSEVPDAYSIVDIGSLVAMTPKEIDLLVETDSDDIAPTLKALWRRYRTKLPI